jgi:hypothetical protein
MSNCFECGTLLLLDDLFCAECGSPIEKPQQESSPHQTEPTETSLSEPARDHENIEQPAVAPAATEQQQDASGASTGNKPGNDDLEARLDAAIKAFTAGHISAETLGRIEAELKPQIATTPATENPQTLRRQELHKDATATPTETDRPNENEGDQPISRDQDSSAKKEPSNPVTPATDHTRIKASPSSFWSFTAQCVVAQGIRHVVVSYSKQTKEIVVVEGSRTTRFAPTAIHGPDASGRVEFQSESIRYRTLHVADSQLPAARALIAAANPAGLGTLSPTHITATYANSASSIVAPWKSAAPATKSTSPAMIGILVSICVLVAVGIVFAVTTGSRGSDNQVPVERPTIIDPELADFEYRWSISSAQDQSQICFQFVVPSFGYFQLTDSQKAFLRSKC